MIPDEIYASSASSSKFQYSHPLNHMPVNDGSMRARLAYDLMEFMRRPDCQYYARPNGGNSHTPNETTDEVDILIVDGYYKEALVMINKRLSTDPDCEKALFQKAFIQQLRQEYERLLDREEKILKHDPKNVNALINKGFALANLNREQEALDISEKVLNIDPENMIALGSKAYIAKSMGKDDLRDKTLAQAYNVSAKIRLRELEKLESKLLRDFESTFMFTDMPTEPETPSAFEAFNRAGGTLH